MAVWDWGSAFVLRSPTSPTTKSSATLNLDDVAVCSFEQVLGVSSQLVNEAWTARTALWRLAAYGLLGRGRNGARFLASFPASPPLGGSTHQFGRNKEVGNLVRGEDVAVGGGFALFVSRVSLPENVSLHWTTDLFQQPHLSARTGRDVQSHPVDTESETKYHQPTPTPAIHECKYNWILSTSSLLWVHCHPVDFWEILTLLTHC